MSCVTGDTPGEDLRGEARAAAALPLASPVRPTAYWYDLCPGREQASAHEPTAAVVGLVVQCPILCWASRAQPATGLLPASHDEREETFFLLKREASVTVRAYKTAACHGSKEGPDETMDARFICCAVQHDAGGCPAVAPHPRHAARWGHPADCGFRQRQLTGGSYPHLWRYARSGQVGQ